MSEHLRLVPVHALQATGQWVHDRHSCNRTKPDPMTPIHSLNLFLQQSLPLFSLTPKPSVASLYGAWPQTLPGLPGQSASWGRLPFFVPEVVAPTVFDQAISRVQPRPQRRTRSTQHTPGAAISSTEQHRYGVCFGLPFISHQPLDIHTWVDLGSQR